MLGFFAPILFQNFSSLDTSSKLSGSVSRIPGLTRHYIYCPRGSDGLYCVRLFFLCTHDNSMKFCMLDNRTESEEFLGYRSKVKVTGPDYRTFHHCDIGQTSLWTR